jgi:hypothetical protein
MKTAEQMAQQSRTALLSSLIEAITAELGYNHGWSEAKIASLASSLLSGLLGRGFLIIDMSMISEFTATADIPAGGATVIELLARDFLSQIADRIAHPQSREIRIQRIGEKLTFSTTFIVL